MTEGKGAGTMTNIAHSGGGAPAQIGGVSSGNLEPLFLELIKAVRQVSLTVNVPALGPPEIEVKVSAPEVHVAAPQVHVAVPQISEAMPMVDSRPVTINVPPQTKLIAAVWCLVASVWCLVVADLVIRLGLPHAVP